MRQVTTVPCWRVDYRYAGNGKPKDGFVFVGAATAHEAARLVSGAVGYTPNTVEKIERAGRLVTDKGEF